MKAARGPAPSTVSSSRETTVGSAVPHRASAAVYSRPVRVGQRSGKREVQRRTHLGEGTLGRVHGAPERGQCKEGALEDEVDERIERLCWRVSGRSPFTRGGVAVSGGAGGKKKRKKKKRRRSLQGGYVRAR